MNEVHPDRVSFEEIWGKIICCEIEDYKKAYPNCIELIPDVKEEIWSNYVELNNFVKTNYMSNQTEVLDRHKVAACYMAAISVVRPMRFVKKIDNMSIPLAINEQMAITVGLSIVRAYVIAATRKDSTLGEPEQNNLIAKFEDGICTPDSGMVWHGSYLDNYANELAFAAAHGKLFVLSLAHELYLLEVITRNQT